MKVNLFIPTYNAGTKWIQVVDSIRSQTITFNRKVIIDSGSDDGTLADHLIADFELIQIDKRSFDHGGTRQMAVETYPDADVFVFMTQDAILAQENAIERLVDEMKNNPKLGMVYGRQLPHINAKTLETHARLFNYPTQSQVRSLADAEKYKVKTISCSNSFSAYHKVALVESGGFPSGSILGEDVIVAGKMLLKGWHMAYVADAQVYHSHDYTIKEEFKRYFDIGVFHRDNDWIFEKFGRAESEGIKYLKSELHYIVKNNLTVLPKAILSLLAKWLGYKVGLNYSRIPKRWIPSLSMHSHFWIKS
ncbi:MAG: glycosyltransferase family 2 protein [Cyclobacteriaceae bacterium]